MDLSIVVPLYNEQESVVPLYEAISGALLDVTDQAEIIFVDDGSRDNTFAVAEQLAGKDKRLRVVKFRRRGRQNVRTFPRGVSGWAVAVKHRLDRPLETEAADLLEKTLDQRVKFLLMKRAK